MSAAEVDAYIAGFPEPVRAALEGLRAAIRARLPEGAGERISYRIPAFEVNGRVVVFFAGYARHLGLYPLPPTEDAELEALLAPYRSGAASLRFPIEAPLPEDAVAGAMRAILARRAV